MVVCTVCNVTSGCICGGVNVPQETLVGPCKGCGETDYYLSTSGTDYCPACACYGCCRRCKILIQQNKSLLQDHTNKLIEDINALERRIFGFETGLCDGGGGGVTHKCVRLDQVLNLLRSSITERK